MKIQIDETPVLKASVESIDIAKVNAYLAKLGQTPLNEENGKTLLHELVNLSITLENMLFRQFTRNQMIASFLTGYGYLDFCIYDMRMRT